MQEVVQHSKFMKGMALFLIVPIILISSFSFPRPARAFFIVPLLVAGLLTAAATVVVIDATTCYINVVWGCSYKAGDGTVTVIDITPSATLSASPSTIDSGQSSTLTWSSTNSTSCTAAGGFSTGNATSGSASVGPLTTTQNYQISCTGPGGSANSNIATVTVRVPTVTISAAPDRVASGGGGGGGTTTISWSATNVNACTITRNGVTWQSLTPDASRALSGSAPDTVTAQTTYAISCTNNASATAVAATATKIVNVVPSFSEF